MGHMSIRSELDAEWQPILRAIRAQHPTTPVLIFGGHHHVCPRFLLLSSLFLECE